MRGTKRRIRLNSVALRASIETTFSLDFQIERARIILWIPLNIFFCTPAAARYQFPSCVLALVPYELFVFLRWRK